MSVYTVTLQGHAFAVAPRLSWTSEAVHRLDTVPPTLGAYVYRIRLEGCRVASSDGTTSGARTALQSFLTSTIHKATIPTSLTITEGASPVPEIGTLTTAAGWDEVLVTSLDLPHSPELLLAGAEFTLEIQARRVFADGNSVVELERTYREQTGADGLMRRELVSRIRMRDGTSVPSTGVVADMLALPLLPGWVREEGGTRGFDVEYPRYGRTDMATTRSVVRQVGGGGSAPEGATGASLTVSRREEVRRGYVEITTAARATGVAAEAGQAWLDEQRPADSWGEETVDALAKTADGRWATRVRLGQQEVEFEVRASLVPGGATMREEPRSGGLRPLLRMGAPRAWRLRVETEAVYLAVDGTPPAPELVRTVAAPPGESWRLDLQGSSVSLPRVTDRGATSGAGDVWEWSSAYEWAWDAEASPITQQLAEFVRGRDPSAYLVPIFIAGTT